jgi:riboflavin kinase/FMN adenylyltransferase
VNIFDFHEDLYDKELSVLFLQRIREERTFGSPAELREQLMADRDQIRQLIEQDSKQNNIRKR